MRLLSAHTAAGALVAALTLLTPLSAGAQTVTSPPRPITGPVKTPPQPVANPVPLFTKIDPATLTREQQLTIQKINSETNAAIRALLAAEHKKVLSQLTDLQRAALTESDLKDNLDNTGELGETESLRLQMAMDRISKFMQTLSNVLKKTSDTNSGIIQNLK